MYLSTYCLLPTPFSLYLYILIHVLPFINHIKIFFKVQSSTQTKIQPFYCTKFVVAPVNAFRLVRKIPECTTEFSKQMFPETFLLVVHTFHIKFYFSGKRQRKSTKNLSKTCHWKLIFVIWSYSTWALRQARHVST